MALSNPLNKPRINNGICEFCGIPAEACPHYSMTIDKPSLMARPVESQSPQQLYRPRKFKTLNLFQEKMADIVIPHYDRHDMLAKVLEHVMPDTYNIIVASGGSFAQNCNRGALAAVTDKIIFLNDDTVPNEHLINAILRDLDQYDVVGCAQKVPSSTEILYGVGFYYEGKKLKAKLVTAPGDVHFPSGFCVGIRRKVFEKFKFDEGFKNGGEDSDLFFRLKEAGHTIYVNPTVIIPHHHGQSEGRLAYTAENSELLNRKWPQEKIEKLFGFSGESLKILLATNHLANFAGSETFTITMAKLLKRCGHKVHVYTLNKGEAADEIPDMIVEQPDDKYDLQIISHNTMLEALKDVTGFKISVCHGKFPKLEQPVTGANKYVAISEEVQEYLKEQGFESTVIRNPIDMKRFLPRRALRKENPRILCLAKGRDAVQLVEEAVGQENFRHVQGLPNIEDYINDADMVVSLGRGAMEALACGRQVIVYDARTYMTEQASDGLITPDNIEELMKCNFSTRRYKEPMTVEKMRELVAQYDPESWGVNRALAQKYFDGKKIVNQYLSLYDGHRENHDPDRGGYYSDYA